jgi:F-type H+-transporting ATPase subunit epsilon
MRPFTLRLLGAVRTDEIEGVTSFVGEDATGLFGILAGRARLMTKLTVGLAKFRVADDPWRYLALPGAVLYFHENVLTLSTRRYLVGDDYTEISRAMQEQLLHEQKQLQVMKNSLQHMEEEIFKRLWKKNRQKKS